MKKTFKLLSLGSLPFFLLIIIMLSIDVIKTDFKYAHQSLYTHQEPFNWLSYRLKTNITKSFLTFTKNSEEGLPIRHIYLDEKLQKELLDKTPSSTKKWKKSLLINNDGSTDKIKIRLKGDNPTNWLFIKKHWKIKKQKKILTERQRYFEYLPFNYEVFLSGKIANSLQLVSPNFKLVELFINDQSKGIYIETETLNEGFLRRNKIMPVNLYKGEQILSESIIGLETNLLNSPGALSKIAYFNQVKKNDKSDIEFLSTTMQLAHNDEESYLSLMEIIDLNYWSKFLSYQILTQNFHNDYTHNFRLIADPWSGKFTPIVYDPLLNLDKENTKLNLDHSSNELFVLLNQNSHFQNLKFEHLNLILNQNIIESEIIKTNFLEDKIKISEGRDIEILSKEFNLAKLFLGLFKNEKKSNISQEKKKKVDTKLSLHLKQIKNFLITEPKANWHKSDNGFQIHVNGVLPVSSLNLFFSKEKPKWIALDLNENNKVDKDEQKLYFDNENILIPYRLFANRLPHAVKVIDLPYPKLKILPTRFKFISENNIKPEKIEFKNPFSKKNYDLIYKKKSSFPVSKYNRPIIGNNNLANKKIILSGIINVDKTKVYRNIVEINPGTTFYINKGASIIFKKRLIALGTKEQPISFLKGGTGAWGTIALQGDGTKNSILENIFFNGGSGDISNNTKYTATLSVQDTKNIIIKNINMKNNQDFDDMLHIVYVDNITLDNLYIEDSFMDAIDIDMSKNVEMKNIRIKNSGNDGIDLMESDVIISNAKIYNSKDKAVSVGENSYLILNNSLFSKNNIAVATKDRSFSFILNSDLIKNNTSLTNYKKNWQYADGGVTVVHQSKLNNGKNILVDKHSTIQIMNSKIENIITEKKMIFKRSNKNHLSILQKNDYLKIIAKLKAENFEIINDNNYMGMKTKN